MLRLLWGIKSWRRGRENNFDGLNSFSHLCRRFLPRRLDGMLDAATEEEGKSALKAAVKIFRLSLPFFSRTSIKSKKSFYLPSHACQTRGKVHPSYLREEKDERIGIDTESDFFSLN